MRKDIREIYKLFEGKLVGRRLMQRYVCEVVSKMPESIVAFITENCWFMGSMEDAWAYAFTGNDLINQHLVFLSDELFLQSTGQIYYSIAHEIGHIVLGHRNSTVYKQSKEEIERQEEEADEFAKRYL